VCTVTSVAQSNSVERLPIKVNGKWGYMNALGNIAIEPQFDAAESFGNNKYAKVKLNGKPGLVNKQGVVAELPTNVKVEVLIEDYLLLEKDGKVGMADINMNILLPIEFSSLKYLEKPKKRFTTDTNEYVLTTYDDSLWGAFNFKGERVLPDKYNYIGKVNNYFFVSTITTEGVFNTNGEEVLPVKFQNVSILNSHYFTAQLNSLWGVYDTSGKQIFKHSWKQIDNINTHWAVFKSEDSSVIVNLKNKTEIETEEFDEFQSYNKNELLVIKQKKRGLYNEKGKLIIPIKYDYFTLINNYYYTQNGKLLGLISQNGRELFPPKYHIIDDMQSNIAIVKKGDFWGLVNSAGKEIASPQYDDIDLGDNTAKCKRGNKLTILTLDGKGNVIERVDYDNVLTFNIVGGNSWANPGRNTQNITVRNNTLSMGNWFFNDSLKKWGYLNNNGDTVIKPIFESVTHTDTSKFAIVQLGKTEYTTMLAGFKVRFIGKKGLVRESDGKIIVKPVMAFIDPIVLRKSGFKYAKALLLSGQYMLISERGGMRLRGCRFVGEQHQGISRAFIGVVGYKQRKAGDVNGISAGGYLRRAGGSVLYEKENADPFGKDLDFKKGYWIYIDSNGRRVNNRYDFAGNFSNNRAIVKIEKKYAVIDNNHQFIIKPEYDFIKFLPQSGNRQFLVEEHKTKKGFIDTLGDPIVAINFSAVAPFNCGNALVTYRTKDGKATYRYFIDENGYKINNEVYSRAKNFSENLALVRHGSGYQFINKEGAAVFSGFKRAGSFKGGRSWIREKGRYIIIDNEGNRYENNVFKRLTPFSQNRATAIVKGRKWVVIDDEANVIGKKKYRRTKKFDELGNCVVAKRRKWGLVNGNGEVLVPFKYLFIYSPKAGKYILRKKRNRYYVYDINDPEQKIKSLGKASKVSVLSSGEIIIHQSRETYIVNEDGKELLVAGAVKPRYVFDDFCIVGGGSRMGVINYNGDTLLKTTYKRLRYLGNNLFYHESQKDDKVEGNIINLKGILVVKNVQKVNTYSNGYTTAMKNNKWGVLDANGIWQTEPKYDYLYPFHNNFAIVLSNKSSYVINHDGELVTDANFEKLAYEIKAKLYRVELGRRLGYLSPHGYWVWKPKQ
jgi:hypothetical protein